jgi:hypothetical protein
MNVLNNARFYLSGAMSFASDGGVGWRQYFTKKLKENNINVFVIDPTSKPHVTKEGINNEVEYCKKLKEEGKWQDLVDFVKIYRHHDLKYTDCCDCLIIKIDKDIHMCGSYDELFVAERQQKPILAIVKDGLYGLPDWLFAVIKLENIFETEDKCIEYLTKINNGQVKLDKKWVLFY